MFSVYKAEYRDFLSTATLLKTVHPDIQPDAISFGYIVDDPRYCILNAVEVGTNKIVGTIMVHLQHKLTYGGRKGAHIEDLVVHPDYRNQGLGQRLIDGAIRWAKLNNAYKAMVTCYDPNVPYFEKAGFKRIGNEMRVDL
jgi:GNAT superfamily N-acetyltransferase